MTLTADLAGHDAAYLALAARASEPYDAFVYADLAQAAQVHAALHAADAGDAARSFGRLWLDGTTALGMIACVPGAALTRIRAAVRGGRSGSSTRRRLDTYACRLAMARGGGSPRQRSSIMRSTETTSPRLASSSASTPRWRGPPRSAAAPFTSACIGPSTLIQTIVAIVGRPRASG